MISYEFFLDLAIILISAKLFGILFRKIKLPQVVGMLVAGLIIGPTVLNIVHTSDLLLQMAELGVIMLMFTAGLETDIKELKSTGLSALLIAFMGVIVPLTGGFLLYCSFYGKQPLATDGFYEALFIGVIITATSVSITVETLREMGKLTGRVGTTILSAAIIDDIIGIILLTFVIGLKNPNVSPSKVLINTGLFFVFAVIVGFSAYYLFKYFDKRYKRKRRMPIYGFTFCLIMAYIAEHFFGIADITGAYLAGIVLCNIKSSDYIVEKMDINSYMIFSPIFFVGIGLKVQLSTMSLGILWFSVAFILVALLAKFIGCGIGAKLCRYNTADSLKIGAGMMARGEVALIVAQKGLNAGILNASFFTPVILMVVCSSVITPIILKFLYKDKYKAKSNAIL